VWEELKSAWTLGVVPRALAIAAVNRWHQIHTKVNRRAFVIDA
jgi:hypothetical protein